MTQSPHTVDLGAYIEHEGRPAIRFVRTYPHAVERVWRAVTDPDELVRWFPARATIDQRVGGAVRFAFAEEVKDEMRVDDGSGTVLVCEPPHRLGYTWESGDARDELYFELESLPDGHCRLTFISVFAQRDAAARDSAGWTVCLAELDRLLAAGQADEQADEQVAGPHSDSALDWKPIYEQYLAAGLPSGAPIPGAA